jgi:hypothetical protein
LKPTYFIIALLICFLNPKLYSQDTSDSTLWVGVHAGWMIGNLNFNPLISYSSVQSVSGGINALYMNEKNIGVSVELNYMQGGWNENNLYEKRFTLLQLPLMTQFQLGKKKFKVLLQVGPHISMLLNESSKVIGDSLEFDYYFTPIENKYMTGVSGGLGFRYLLNENQSISIETRINQGLSGIFKQNGNTEFVLSQPQFIGGYLKYQWKLSKRKKDDSVQRDSED